MKKNLTAWTTLAAAGLLAACSSKEKPRPLGPTVSVETTLAARTSLPSPEDYVGNIRSRQAVRISTKMMGRVQRIFVQEGQAVRKGEPLVEVDASEARSAQAQAQAGLDAADVAVRNAERDYGRFQALYAEKAVTKHQLEQVEMGLAQARAQREQAAANLQMARTLLTYGEILAPDRGIITKKWMDEGNLAYPGAPILTLENPEDLEISVDVPEERARLLAAGQKAAVTVDSLGRTFEVAVSAVVGAADPLSRTSTVKLGLPKDESLRPGQFAHVRFERFALEALAVPASALVTEGQMDGVYVAEGGIARLRWIQTGQRARSFVQVLSGLEAGDRVIDPVPAGLTDGAPIEVAR
jgi:multidrug efflux system membrane fusion protein